MIKTAVIEAINSGVDTIIADNARLREQILKLINERDSLLDDKRRLTAKLDEINKRVAVLEMADAVGGAAGNTEAAKARVGRLLREIDRCIELINK